ncbi:hypothetical protein Pint_33093 [Pistacia integerrima]|uniref:Uncharacterized protein n=1 Tax=Pistacia integerrima TaxID=434235 RepID=A0ACC0X577_9ROSI|nr:hypothetical protein Pint_33093 [Pistacia integerrima]KAJ0077852.1 hypothetical protein Patl1_36678 [Pistacia atlantica]
MIVIIILRFHQPVEDIVWSRDLRTTQKL